MSQARSWILLLVAFDAIYWLLCGLLFGRVVEVSGIRATATKAAHACQ